MIKPGCCFLTIRYNKTEKNLKDYPFFTNHIPAIVNFKIPLYMYVHFVFPNTSRVAHRTTATVDKC